MKKRILTATVFICLILVGLSACGDKAGQEEVFDLSRLQTEDGAYQYKDIPFGSSYEEVAKKIPLKLEEMTSESGSAWSFYYSVEPIAFYGEEGKFSLEFTDDKLETVKASAELSGGEEQFEELAGKMVEWYGEAEVNVSETATIYSWEKNGGHINAILFEDSGKYYGIFGVFYMEE
ncbi:MAG: hypothetical protein Q4C58_04865 [Eubacteriales bacterium]|nr:hypothetical protein [Eubacteriales bacterium]